MISSHEFNGFSSVRSHRLGCSSTAKSKVVAPVLPQLKKMSIILLTNINIRYRLPSNSKFLKVPQQILVGGICIYLCSGSGLV